MPEQRQQVGFWRHVFDTVCGRYTFPALVRAILAITLMLTFAVSILVVIAGHVFWKSSPDSTTIAVLGIISTATAGMSAYYFGEQQRPKDSE